MSSVAVIGSGMSGITIARMLHDANVRVDVFESGQIGGLVHCSFVDQNLFHKTGGHVFNSKNVQVWEWFNKLFDINSEFISAVRNAAIYFQDQEITNSEFIDYPIENNIHKFREETARTVISELISLDNSLVGSDFKSFFLSRFGRTLSEMYFLPYNEKIWNQPLERISTQWLEGKLPSPSTDDILYSNIFRSRESNMVHSTFFYPKSGGSQFIIDRISEPLTIHQKAITSISHSPSSNKTYLNNNPIPYDFVVYTGSLKSLPSMLVSDSRRVLDEFDSASDLPSNSTVTFLCSADRNPYSWVYVPSPDIPFHRVIMTGNFSNYNNSPNLPHGRISCTAEVSVRSQDVDSIDIEFLQSMLNKLPFNLQYISHNISRLSYVIHNHQTSQQAQHVIDQASKFGIICHGRFAEWQYYNMDSCILESINKSKSIHDALTRV